MNNYEITYNLQWMSASYGITMTYGLTTIISATSKSDACSQFLTLGIGRTQTQTAFIMSVTAI